jgi:hypothetical protein
MDKVALSDWLNILAILLSPLIALQVGKWLDNFSNKKRRKEEIFNTLMETRAQAISYEHVRALNKIDIAFSNDAQITRSWNVYRDHLNSYPQNPTDADQKIWNSTAADKLAELLYEMAKLLGYDFDIVMLKKGAYIPIAHGRLETEQALIRMGLVKLFVDHQPLRVELIDKKQPNPSHD